MLNTKKVLLAFSSYPGKGLMREILSQLDRGIRVDFALNELELMYYLSLRTARRLPGLIIFDNPPVRPDIKRLVETIRNENACNDIPIAFFLSQQDIPMVMSWVGGKGVHCYPLSPRPSEWKFYLKQTLSLYKG